MKKGLSIRQSLVFVGIGFFIISFTCLYDTVLLLKIDIVN